MIKVGIAGLGNMGKNHCRVLSEIPDVELVGGFDPDWLMAEIVGKRYGFPEMTLQDLIKTSDVIVVCCPTSEHFAVACEAMKGGRHVLIEKPLARTETEGSMIVKLAQQMQVVATVGHIERFNPTVQKLVEEVGPAEIRTMHFTRVGPLPPERTNTNVVMELAIHDIDLLRHIGQCEIADAHAFIEHADSAVLSFKTDTGVVASCVANWLTPYKVRTIEVACRGRYLFADLIQQRLVEYTRYTIAGPNASPNTPSYVTRDIRVPYGEPLRLEWEEFLGAVGNATHDGVAEATERKMMLTDGLAALAVATSV